MSGLIIAGVTASTISASAAAYDWDSGVYPGGTINLAAEEQFADYVGRPLGNVHVFPDPPTWSYLATNTWEVSQYNGYPGLLVVDVPLLPSQQTASLSDVAAGVDDSYFQSMAENLVALGRGNSILVLGSEFNGNWQTYSAFDPATFVAAFRRVVGVIRAVPDEHFLIDWTGNAIDNQAGHDPFTEDYPGNGYVDIIGVDAYDYADSAIQTLGFDQWANQPYGIEAWLNFAIENGKPFSVPEWGLTGADTTWGSPTSLGSGDDPAYIRGMFDFFTANYSHLAFEDYFNQPGARDYNSLDTPGMMPQSSALYQQLWSTLPADGNPSVTQVASSVPATASSTLPSPTTSPPVPVTGVSTETTLQKLGATTTTARPNTSSGSSPVSSSRGTVTTDPTSSTPAPGESTVTVTSRVRRSSVTTTSTTSLRSQPATESWPSSNGRRITNLVRLTSSLARWAE